MTHGRIEDGWTDDSSQLADRGRWLLCWHGRWGPVRPPCFARSRSTARGLKGARAAACAGGARGDHMRQQSGPARAFPSPSPSVPPSLSLAHAFACNTTWPALPAAVIVLLSHFNQTSHPHPHAGSPHNTAGLLLPIIIVIDSLIDHPYLGACLHHNKAKN
jgi:hypothetical protein